MNFRDMGPFENPLTMHVNIGLTQVGPPRDAMSPDIMTLVQLSVTQYVASYQTYE